MNQRYLPGLDTLRAMAILLVVFAHARDYFKLPFVKLVGDYGWSGVDLFFVLSGFLIGSQLFHSLKIEGRIDFFKFYLKRAFRILPVFWVVLLLYYIWPAFLEQPAIDPAWHFLTFTMNFHRVNNGFSHAWSLCVEEHFYLIFPLVVSMYVAMRKMPKPLTLIVGIFLGEILLRYIVYLTGATFSSGVYRPTFTRLDGLTVGVAIALIKVYRPYVWNILISKPWLLFIVGIGFYSLGMNVYFGSNATKFMFTFPIVAFGFGALIIAAQSPGFWFADWKIPGVSSIAAFAYTLYLTHKQMLHLASTIIINSDENLLLTILLSIVLMLVAAFILHFGIEKPFLKLRDRIVSNSYFVKTNKVSVSV